MIKLILTQREYKELSDQIEEGDQVRFHLDGRGELHYPDKLRLSEHLERAMRLVCARIGPDRYLTIFWGGYGGLDAHVCDTGTNADHRYIEIRVGF